MHRTDQDAEKPEVSCIVDRSVKWYSHLKNCLVVLTILNTNLPFNPAIASLGTYKREMGTYVHKKTFT